MGEAQTLFETGAATHVGLVRPRNEDSYLTRPEVGIWAVADGMGGHKDGDLASHTVIEALKSDSGADFRQRITDPLREQYIRRQCPPYRDRPSTWRRHRRDHRCGSARLRRLFCLRMVRRQQDIHGSAR